jgi:hypothetical protein
MSCDAQPVKVKPDIILDFHTEIYIIPWIITFNLYHMGIGFTPPYYGVADRTLTPGLPVLRYATAVHSQLDHHVSGDVLPIKVESSSVI